MLFLTHIRGESKTLNFYETRANPGIGGSEAYIINLSIALFAMGLGVRLGIIGETKIVPPDMRILTDLDDKPDLVWDAIVHNASDTRVVNGLDLIFAKRIVISHHPHDASLFVHNFSRNTYIVSLGHYQSQSNVWFSTPIYRIPGLSPCPKKQSAASEKGIIGFIGSLHKSKGLHHALSILSKLDPKSWNNFEVIGANALYSNGKSDEEQTVPIDNRRYRKKILRLLNNQNLKDKVVFQGLVDRPEEYMKTWSAAILNPRGIGEADSQSLKELLCMQIPVFASEDYGLGDHMKAFPAMTITGKKYRGDAKKIGKFLEYENTYIDFRVPLNNFLLMMAKNDVQVLSDWSRMLRFETRDLETYFFFRELVKQPTLQARIFARNLKFLLIWVAERLWDRWR